MSKNITISVVIPNWNGASLLSKNLPKIIEAKKNKENKIQEIIVVDDGSTDNSVDIIKVFSKEVKLVKHSVNRGFPFAVHTGVRFASGSHICLLNTDVIPFRDFLVHVVKYLKDSQVFGVTLHEKGFGPARGRFDGYLKHFGGEEGGEVAETLWLSGGSCVFSKKVWKTLKGMDSELLAPFYWEDVDLGYRAQKRGYRLLWVPEAKVIHAHESVINTNNFKRKYLNIIKERNELLFIWKNITSASLIKKHKKELVKRIVKHPGYIQVFIAAALKWNLAIKRRRKEKEESIVSDEAIFAKFS